jgi:AGZA family xanthine/uracil permease-like MFS transporter
VGIASRIDELRHEEEPAMTTTTATTAYRPPLWTSGDWNAFFGFGTNILVNMLVLTGLLRFVIKMPDSIVFGRILPALGLMLCLSTFYYAYLAYRLARATGRSDVCALPSGVSVPHMFIVTFVIMLPIALKTNDPIKGWEAGLVWVFFQSFILMIGGFIAPIVRKITPRAALLGTLAGVSITFISMRPALQMYMTPVIGLTCFAVIIVSWFGGFRYPKGIPAGLVAIAVGVVIAWGSNAFGLNYGGLSVKGIGDAFTNFGFSVPLPAVDHIFSGFQYLGVILITAIPFGIYDLVEAMDNVESAEAAGDPYPTTRVLTADGVVSLIGCLMGNPFINAVYIGHPGWKAMGGRIGYSAATGIMVIVLAWFGVISLLLAVIPVVAISPILLYIGMLIGAQAFQSTPKTHAPAIVLALTPHLAAWCTTLMDGALGAAGTSAAAIGMDKLGNVGVLYEGLKVMGGGAILTGLVLAAIGAFVIDKKFVAASAFALAGAVLTFFGFMHGESVGIAVTPTVAVAYLIVAVFLFALSRSPAVALDRSAPHEAISDAALAATPAE